MSLQKQLALINRFIVDAAIITVLPEEFNAVKRRLINIRHDEGSSSHPNIFAWELGELPCDSTGQTYKIVIAQIGKAGNINGALATFETIMRWNPRYVFLVGIAGSLNSSELENGDIIISEVVWGYEYGKIKKSFVPRHNITYPCDISLLNGALSFASKYKLIDEIKLNKPENPAKAPKILSGPIASGDKVVDNPNQKFFAAVLAAWPKLLAVEMESAGAASAIAIAHSKGYNVGFLMIRGISDIPQNAAENITDSQTSERDKWKEYAADIAADFAVSYIRSGLPTPPLILDPGESKIREAISIIGTSPSEFVALKNPYIAGPPLGSDTDLFVGREELVELITSLVKKHSEDQMAPNGILLYGPHRSGKTSILYQLENLFGPEFKLIYIDINGISIVPLICNMLEAIAALIPKLDTPIDIPNHDEFSTNPVFAMTTVINSIITACDPQKPVLMFDESDVLTNFSDNNEAIKNILNFMRSLVENNREVFFIFASCRDIRWIENPHLSHLLTLFYEPIKVDLLKKTATISLILDPVKDFFTYSEDALINIMKLSGCHPCFTQLICRQAVDWRNHAKVNVVPTQAINAIIKNSIERGHSQFVDLCKELSHDEMAILYSLSYVLKGGEKATKDEILKQLKVFKLKIVNWNMALDRLMHAELIYADGDYFYLRIGILKYWIYRTPKNMLFQYLIGKNGGNAN